MHSTAGLRVGLFGIGLEAYWPQFTGLKSKLEGYLTVVANRLAKPGVTVVNAGLVDNVDRAFTAAEEFRRRDVDLIVLHVTTYALSSTVLPIVRRTKGPVLVLNLCPEPAIDYTRFNASTNRTQMTGEWLAHCCACPVPELANVFRRAGVQFHQVTGMLQNDPEAWQEIDDWLDAAKVVSALATNRLGLMGHYYGGMLDIYSDVTLHCATFGTHIEMIEVDELSGLRDGISTSAAIQRVAEFQSLFDVQPDCAAHDLQEAAKTSLALDQLVAARKLGSLAYYYSGTGVPRNEETIASIILGTSVLTMRGIPVAGEYEVKNVHAMKIMDLFGAGGSFSEYYAMDFRDDVVLMGHDGPGHLAIAEGKSKVRPLREFHGKVGRGVSVEMSVKRGPVTLLSVIEGTGGKLALLCAEAESVSGPILEIGNTNSRYRFPCGARKFVERWNSYGPAHHWAIGVGHIADRLRKLGLLLNLEVHVVD